MGLVKTSILLLILAVVSRHVYRVGMKMGYHKMVYSHSPGACHLVPGMVNGSEDIQVLSNGLALISSGFQLPIPEHIGRKGALYLFDFNNPNEGATRLEFTGVTIDSAHGLGVWEEPDNDEVTVFLIDHPSAGDCVHKFEFAKNTRTLTYVKSITDKTFITLNNILPTGPDSFYATNSYGSKNKLIQALEFILFLHHGTVTYYNGQTGHIMAENLALTNGINMSPDGKFLYIASTLDEAFHIFHRMPDNNLVWKQVFMLHTLPDNINVDKDTGDLWIGALPIFHQVAAHMSNPQVPSPSQVLRLKMKDGDVESIEEIFVDEGKKLFGSSVSIRYKDAMLIGTIAHKLMYCKIEHLD